MQRDLGGLCGDELIRRHESDTECVCVCARARARVCAETLVRVLILNNCGGVNVCVQE